MISKSSRLKFARYKLTGVFGADEDYSLGNPTFFVLPPTTSPYIHMVDSLFYTVSIDNFFLDQTQ